MKNPDIFQEIMKIKHTVKLYKELHGIQISSDELIEKCKNYKVPEERKKRLVLYFLKEH
jgi:hypothetical protein